MYRFALSFFGPRAVSCLSRHADSRSTRTVVADRRGEVARMRPPDRAPCARARRGVAHESPARSWAPEPCSSSQGCTTPTVCRVRRRRSAEAHQPPSKTGARAGAHPRCAAGSRAAPSGLRPETRHQVIHLEKRAHRRAHHLDRRPATTPSIYWNGACGTSSTRGRFQGRTEDSTRECTAGPDPLKSPGCPLYRWIVGPPPRTEDCYCCRANQRFRASRPISTPRLLESSSTTPVVDTWVL